MALKVRSTTRRSALARTAGSTTASVVRYPSIVAMRGSIMPEPLAMPPTMIVPSALSAATASAFGNGSVVMMARDCAAPAAPRSRQASAVAMPARIFRDVERHANDAGRRDKGVIRTAASGRGGRGRHLPRDVHAVVARARVRAPAVRHDDLRPAAGPCEMFARDDDRRRDGLVGREHRGRRGDAVSDEKRQVERAVNLPDADA